MDSGVPDPGDCEEEDQSGKLHAATMIKAKLNNRKNFFFNWGPGYV
jgi:hypothetical protein